ncbi:unnamed protein product [Aspergillus oryzae]|nr:unnamed protein product [Aspergillus oryzae]
MEQPQSLRALFAAAKSEKSALESRFDTNTEQYRNDVNATIAKLEECARLVAVLSLFSSNEPLEDIATGDLPQLQTDDEDVRQLYIAEIKLYTHQTFQSLDLLSQELSMLSAIRNSAPAHDQIQPEDTRRRKDAQQPEYSGRLDPPLSQLLQGGKFGPILSKDGKPMQPFTLLDRRTQLQQGVFRSGHNLPTMTIDEYLEEEKRRGGIIEGGEKSGIQEEVDEDDMDRADEETMKARAWDEFTEANPRGSGNTLNRG